ncbi:hypothetical protein GGI42DRAFT_196368 [Trichoderma sp. SZMC 28013]
MLIMCYVPFIVRSSPRHRVGTGLYLRDLARKIFARHDTWTNCYQQVRQGASSCAHQAVARAFGTSITAIDVSRRSRYIKHEPSSDHGPCSGPSVLNPTDIPRRIEYEYGTGYIRVQWPRKIKWRK